MTGITRDETIAQNLIRLLFVKLYDENLNSNICNFAFFDGETLNHLESKIHDQFEQVKKTYKELFEIDEKLQIKGKDLAYIVTALQDYSISNSDRDVIVDAFEELIGRSFEEEKAVFYSSKRRKHDGRRLRNKNGEKIIDPACGSGGFLVSAYRKTSHDKKYKNLWDRQR